MSQDTLAGQRRAYEVWAPFYDSVYHALLRPVQRAAVAAASACGPDILEVGVGTGLTLPYWPAGCRVVGVDLSAAMLRRAATKALPNGAEVRLAAMDACRLALPDGHFDAATALFVITLVPDPEGALDEMARVVRPGGEIVIASRFGAEGGVQGRIETALAPLMARIGWSSDFRLSRIRRWAAANGFDVRDVRPGYFKVVRLRKRG